MEEEARGSIIGWCAHRVERVAERWAAALLLTALASACTFHQRFVQARAEAGAEFGQAVAATADLGVVGAPGEAGDAGAL